MAKRQLPSIELLRQLLRYEPETGRLFWKERPVEMFEGRKYPAARLAASWNAKHAGTPALNSVREHGYLGGHVHRLFLYAHQVAWALHHGEWPEHQIDHRDGLRARNVTGNLKDAPQSHNAKNRAKRKCNTSGFAGVYWHETNRKWIARMGLDRKTVYIGSFDTKEEAIAARKAENEKHGFTERHGT